MLNKLHRLGYSESYAELQNCKYCFLNNMKRVGTSNSSGTLDTIIEETDDKINAEFEVDIELENLSALTIISESATPDEVSIEIAGINSNRAVTQFVGQGVEGQRVPLHSTHCVPIPKPGDWMLLQSMSLDPSGYEWMVGIQGYEPVPTLEHMAPEELLEFTSCKCRGHCSNRRCSCRKNDVKCISACGNCKGIMCKNCTDDEEPGEDSDLDS